MSGAGRGALLALCAVLALAPSAARAQQSPGAGLGLGREDQGKPVTIEAERGIEWQQNSHVYVARGHVKATRGRVTVYADTLYAYYRPSAHGRAGSAGQATGGRKSGAAGLFGGGSTEIYRLEADGHVRFVSEAQTVYGDHAVYDVDRAILVVTGQEVRLVTPRDTVIAHDSLEWYDTRQLAVARGDALAVREGKRLKGDVLTATLERLPGQSSHISRIDAQGHVLVSSMDQIAQGDAGVYDVDTGIATLTGHVRLTRNDNELRGEYAVVDLNNNVSRLLSAPPGAKVSGAEPPRVEGLLVPRSKSAPAKP